jgi:hypothetical protein
MRERPARDAGWMGRLATQARWLVTAVLVVAFVLWLVLFAPRLLVPAASPASLRDVPDAAKWQARDSRLKLQNDVRTTLLQGLGGLAVLLGASFTYRQLRITREGQVTERFTRAIDQLGHENLDVRLGGIYALERIANDSPQDRTTVAEVLTAYVRGHAPWPPSQPTQEAMEAPPETVSPLQMRAPDVQAAMTVLGRRRPPIGSAERLDLTNTDLRYAYLGGAQLQRADLTGARLQGADLYRAQLQGAKLIAAQLQGAYLVATQFQGAQLVAPEMPGADLEDAQLQGAQCNAQTVWPVGFNWEVAGVVQVD